MERLTAPSKTGPKRYVSALGSGYGSWPRIIQRLAAYENTGLEPEQVVQMATEQQRLMEPTQKWIPVTERLPDNCNERVLVRLPGNCVFGSQNMDTDRYRGDHGKWVRYGDKVTHWMPLPENPKED